MHLVRYLQQPLAEGAARLLRFEAFIQEEAEKTSQARRIALHTEYKPLAAHVLTLNLDDVTYSEIEALEPQLAVDTRTFEQALTVRQDAIKTSVTTHQWDGLTQELNDPALRIQALADKLNGEAETLEKASDEKVRAALQKQFGHSMRVCNLLSVRTQSSLQWPNSAIKPNSRRSLRHQD